MIAKTVDAVKQCVGASFKRSHIALITYRGRESSRFTPYTKLGPYSLRAPTGQYDLLGTSIFTEGDLLIDSVHRFKGRAVPCVVFTEIDFERLDDAAMRRLFVGATRATMKLTLVGVRAVGESIARAIIDCDRRRRACSWLANIRAIARVSMDLKEQTRHGEVSRNGSEPINWPVR
jgi:hypothetical protein